MKDGFIKVAAISPKMKVADVAFNTTEICEKIDEAAKEKAKIVVMWRQPFVMVSFWR